MFSIISFSKCFFILWISPISRTINKTICRIIYIC
jgi:hypothetical protein